LLILHVRQTTWGSRAGADANDDWRLIRLPPYGGPAAAGPEDQPRADTRNEFTEDYQNEEDSLLPRYGDDA